MRKLIPAVTLFTALHCYNAPAQTITRNVKDNTVKSVVYDAGEGPSVDNADNLLPSLLELDNNHVLKLKYTHPAANGLMVSKYAQWYNNIPVEHGSATIMIINNRLTSVNANVFKPVQALNTVPAITEAQALDIALNLVNAKEYMWEGNDGKAKINHPSMQYPKGTLVWVEDFTNNEPDKQLYLAYRFEIFAKEPMSNDRIYVDAVTGKVLLKDPKMKHVAATGTAVYSGSVGFETNLLSPGSYSLEDVTRNVYTYDLQSSTNFTSAVDFTNSTTTWGKDYSIDAHWGMTKVYDYWKNEHSRTSYDGMGSNLISFLNYGISYNNAFWTGDYMVYGNGSGMFNSGFEPLVSLDVCSHELGHGICEYTAGLVYNREAGAMNEGFSDIWGAVVENYAAPDKQMWSVGEELRVGALRSMSNPNLYTDPDCHSGLHWVTVTGCNPTGGNDYCGVHTNSGVLNYWFYLLVEGGNGKNDLNNDFEVSGIGVKKAANIAYATELALNSTDNYAACRTASINAAAAIYGNCSREVEAVTRAWYAVGVGTAFSPCAPQVGFAIQDTAVNKTMPGVVCPSSQSVSIPMRVFGTSVGGNAVVTIGGAGNVNGGDYSIPANQLTFNAGSTASQNVLVNIFDNGDVAKDKMLKLYFTIAQNGSNLSTSYTYDTCYITILGSRITPDTGNNVAVRINNADVKSKAITPFFSRNALARTQFLIKAEELQLAGIKPNEPITALEFNVTAKHSAQPFSNFRLKIAPTLVQDLSAGNPTVSTVYHQSNYTTQLGWNRLVFSTPLVWNGTDNLAVETCFTNATAGIENDYVQGVGTGSYGTTVAHSGSGSDGCNLSFSSGFNYFSISKPVIRLVQSKQALSVEKIVVGSRQWDVHPGQNIYFNNDTNGKLIAAINNSNQPLGCTDVQIVAQGNGLKPIGVPFGTAARSHKEFSVTATQNAATAGYELTLYFDTSELSPSNLANFRILATTASHDSLMTAHNTQQVTPIVTQGSNAYAFKGQFTGAADKYFLVDQQVSLPNNVANVSKNTGNILVLNNPFADKIFIRYAMVLPASAQVKLYDITGKILVQQTQQIPAGQHNTVLNTGDVVPGNYILQVVTDKEVFTQKMVKQ